MYVKSLTLKGFKSFASATKLRLEPGITCIVGPNGSGKSNVVDALAWVMGEQGAKSLRGGKMEDVIFAGTSGRAPLGRAEVTMTIDNTDGALPIDYSEVTISRTMFRNGGSDYAINGTSCRLLDIQELLSDSGIGREMHVIVGQGQLDAVLRATPEERRGFIEEAAGVLKHRKRKEKALRKLDTMEDNLTRLGDLTSEIRRQLGPLGRQAETARRAATIQAEVRDARLRILADDLVQLTSTLEQELADETAMLERRGRVEQALASAQATVAALEAEAAQAAPALAEAQERFYALSALVERTSATADLARERVRLLAGEDEEDTGSQGSGRDPEQLRTQAAALREQERQSAEEITAIGQSLEGAEQDRRDAETAHHEEQQRLTRLARAAADRREGLARLSGRVAAARSRLEAGEAEIGRLEEVREATTTRAADAEQEFAALEGRVLDVEEGEEGLDQHYEAAEAARLEAAALVEDLTEQVRAAESDRSRLAARCEALAMSLDRKDGAATLLAGGEGRGVVGAVSGLVTVQSGYEPAIAAALGWAGEGLVMETLDHARAAVAALRESDAGRAALLVPQTAGPTGAGSWPELPDGAAWARDVVTAPDHVAPAVEALLERVAVVADDAAAAALLDQADGTTGTALTAVTREGDVYGRGWVRGGSSAAPSLIEIESALEQAQEEMAAATARGEQATFALATAREELATHTTATEQALSELHDSDAKMAAVAEKLGSLGAAVRAARAEQERVSASITRAREGVETGRQELATLTQRLADAEAEPGEEEPSTQERDRLAAVAAAGRSKETEIRLQLRTQEERARALQGRAESLEAAARSEIAARERAAARRERRAHAARVATAVAEGSAYLLVQVEQLVTTAAQVREEARSQAAEREQRLGESRGRVTELGDQLRELTDSVHRDEVARAEQRLRIEALQTKAIEELGIDPEALVEEFGPHQLIPAVPGPDDDPDDLPDPKPFVREEQDKRLRSAGRKLTALGKVNPLALEEFAALEERHKFLTEQVDDLRRSKEDLLAIIKEVDDRVERVFAEAFEDTAEQFAGVFSRLFPGGEGRLTLTNPDDLLTTGIEVEARPPGKKIKRLSLLSGGERSLTAVALLVSIFKARPSPFYIMDEVEAALDDTNLGRLITLFEELRDSSQLIVITHQKRTMEVADALYGVSMKGDGVTTVISQRLRDVQPQPA